MKNFSIIEPFTIDWRLAAPRDFDTLELFVTPDVSLIFHNITNGKEVFKIGAYLMEDAGKIAQFMNEVLPQRSQERIKRAFESEDISAFFSLEDAKGLNTLFLEEGFICRRVEVLHNGISISVPELPEDDFNKVIKLFGELKVVHTTDFETQWEDVQEAVNEIREDVARGLRKQQAQRDAKMVGMTKKTMVIRGAIGTSLIALSAGCAGFSKTLLGKSGWKNKMAGAVVGTVAVISGIAGKQMTSTIVEHVQKGLILNYG